MTTTTGSVMIAAILAALWALKNKNGDVVATVETSEGYDLTPYGGPLTVPQPIQQLAQAIARAEGFYVNGSIPQRAHNPGDLKIPDASKPTLRGITVFESDAQGWEALYRQLNLIVSGRSAHYDLDDTILDMARTWTTTEQTEWANNVASALNVPTSTRLGDLLT